MPGPGHLDLITNVCLPGSLTYMTVLVCLCIYCMSCHTPDAISLRVRRKLMASLMMDALSRCELMLCERGSWWASS